MWSLYQAENSGSLIDIRADEGNEFIFCDHNKETSESRRDMTYYQIQEAAEAMGVDIQSEEGWRALQEAGKFDSASWIWIKSEDIIETGDARFAYRDGGNLNVCRHDADNRHPYGGWRVELRVPKAQALNLFFL